MSDTDLSHHYKVFKQFLDISNDANTRGKSSSSRAARAREKLLKLSGAQFRELSTDVYDELRRRIDESRSEPDFLLPRSAFHPKRNQARQKLSSLPQSRFKDLVSDISFEIERRDLQGSTSTQAQAQAQAQTQAQAQAQTQAQAQAQTQAQAQAHSRSQSQSQLQSRAPSAQAPKAAPASAQNPQNNAHISDPFTAAAPSEHSARSAASIDSAALRDELATPDLRKRSSEKPIGVQATTVVPTRASMAWSTDEEEEEDSAAPPSNSRHEEPRQFMLPNAFAAPRLGPTPTSTDQRTDQSSDAKYVANAAAVSEQLEMLKATHANLLKDHDSLNSAFRDAQVELKELIASNRTMEQELVSMKEAHSELLVKEGDLKALVEQLTRENSAYQAQQATFTSPEKVSQLQKEFDELWASHESLLAEKQILEQKASRSTLHESPHIREMSDARSTSHMNTKPPGSLDVNAELKKLHEKLIQDPQNSQHEQFSRRESRLRNEVSQWQQKYAALKAENTKRSTTKTEDLSRLRASHGLISYKSAVALFSAIDVFYAALDISNPDADLLFEHISSIAILANKIADQAAAGSLGQNSQADAIRESASHALTATRYFVVYPTLMPKIIVERAVGETAFAACDLISTVKLSSSSEHDASHESKPKDFTTNEVDIDVKPLRITQKISESNSRAQSTEWGASGDITPKKQGFGKIYPPADAPSLSSTESIPKETSSPISSKDLTRNIIMSHDADTKQSSSGLSSFKSLFGNRGESHADSISDEVKQEPEVQVKSPGSGSFPSTVTPDTEEKTGAGFIPKVFGTSKTSSLLDKVKKFDTQSSNRSPVSNYSHERIPSTSSTEHASGLPSNSPSNSPSQKSQGPQSPESQRSTVSSTDGAPSRNKSIFQSLKARFASEGSAKSAAQAEGTSPEEIESQQVNEPDHDKSFEHRVGAPTRLGSGEAEYTTSILQEKPTYHDTTTIVSASGSETSDAIFDDMQGSSKIRVPLASGQNVPEPVGADARSPLRPTTRHVNSSNYPSTASSFEDLSTKGERSGSTEIDNSDMPSNENPGMSANILSGRSTSDPKAESTGAQSHVRVPASSNLRSDSRDEITRAQSHLRVPSSSSLRSDSRDESTRAQSHVRVPSSSSLRSGSRDESTRAQSHVRVPSSSSLRSDSRDESTRAQSHVRAPSSSSLRSDSRDESTRAQSHMRVPSSSSLRSDSRNESTRAQSHMRVPSSSSLRSDSVDESTGAHSHTRVPSSSSLRSDSRDESTRAQSHARIPSSSSGKASVSAISQEETLAEDKSFSSNHQSSVASERSFEVSHVRNADVNPDEIEYSKTQKKTMSGSASSPSFEKAKSDTYRRVGMKASQPKVPGGLKIKSPSFKVRKIYSDAVEDQHEPQNPYETDEESYDEEEDQIRQRQDYRKSMAAATFNFDLFDIDDPDNTVTQVLLYLEHQTVQVISTIQDLLSAIKKPDATRGELRDNSNAISKVIRQMTEATNTSMNQTRNYQLKEHGSWVVKSLEDCNHRMGALCKPDMNKDDEEFADRHFKQRLAGISFDIAKCTKELVKTVEEASLKEDIAHLDARINLPDDLT